MDEIWQIVYDSNERGFTATVGAAAAFSSQKNDLQFRLQNLIADFKQNPRLSVLEDIEADVRLSQSMGLMTEESTERVLEILRSLR